MGKWGFVAAGAVSVAVSMQWPEMASAQSMEQMQAMLERQQQMIEQMQREQQELRRAYEEMKRSVEAQKTAAQAQPAAPAQAPAGPTVVSRNEKIKVTVGGHVNRMVTVSNDGQGTDVFHVDNDNSQTRLRVTGTGKVSDKMTIGTVLEAGLSANRSASVSQTNQDTGSFNFNGRVAEVFFAHDDYGRLTVGQGSTVTDGVAGVDLSGTDVIQYSGIVDQAGGLMFYDNSAGAYGPDIDTVFSNFDGNGRANRLRYDSPRFNGFFVAGDVASNRRWSVAAGYEKPADVLPDYEVQSIVGFAERHTANNAQRLTSSASVLHKDTGLSFTVSGGIEFNDSGREPWSMYFKPGWQTSDLTTLGTTAFSFDYGQSNWLNAGGDAFGRTSSEAQTFGVAAVQRWTEFGVEFFSGYRWHNLEEDGRNFDDIHVISVGTRIRF